MAAHRADSGGAPTGRIASGSRGAHPGWSGACEDQSDPHLDSKDRLDMTLQRNLVILSWVPMLATLLVAAAHAG